jgi:hypothetical protein
MSSVKYPSWIDGDECLVSYILAVHGYFNEKVRMERRTLKRSLLSSAQTRLRVDETWQSRIVTGNISSFR